MSRKKWLLSIFFSMVFSTIVTASLHSLDSLHNSYYQEEYGSKHCIKLPQEQQFPEFNNNDQYPYLIQLNN